MSDVIAQLVELWDTLNEEQKRSFINEQVVSTQDACRILDISAPRLAKLIEENKIIPIFRNKGTSLFLLSSIEAQKKIAAVYRSRNTSSPMEKLDNPSLAKAIRVIRVVIINHIKQSPDGSWIATKDSVIKEAELLHPDIDLHDLYKAFNNATDMLRSLEVINWDNLYKDGRGYFMP